MKIGYVWIVSRVTDETEVIGVCAELVTAQRITDTDIAGFSPHKVTEWIEHGDTERLKIGHLIGWVFGQVEYRVKRMALIEDWEV